MARNNKKNFDSKGKEGFKDAKGSKNQGYSAKRGRSNKKDVSDRDSGTSGYRTGDLESVATNDIEWYNKYPNMFNDATRVPFNKIAGKTYYDVSPSLSNSYGNVFSTLGSYMQPSIITMDYVPGIGVTRGFNDAPNRAFKSLWSALYSKTTGIINFPVHVLAAMYCVQQSIAQNIAYVKRALEISNTYVANNHNFPNKLLRALGLNDESILGKQDEIRWRLNNYIREFNQMKIPRYIDIFVRHYRMARNVYMDQASEISQLFMFRPVCYYVYCDLGKYDVETETYDGQCRAEALIMPYLVTPDTDDLNELSDSERPVDISEILDVIQEQLRSVVMSDDYVQVLGAMQRAFDNAQFIELSEVTSDDTVTVKVDEYINYQIHNANFAGRVLMDRITNPSLFEGTKWAMFGGAIEGNKSLDLITYQPCTSGGSCNAYDNVFLNTFENGVDQNWVAETTRLACILDKAVNIVQLISKNRSYHYLKTCGSEFITQMRVWVPTTNDGIYSTTNAGVITIASDDIDNAFDFLTAITKFKFAPRVWINDENSTKGYIGDIHFWTSIDDNTLRGLHETCLLSQLSTTSDIKVKQYIPV